MEFVRVNGDGVASDKTPVFGLLKRGGKVYTKVIPNAKQQTLIPIIKDKVVPDSIVYSDSWKGYNALDVSEFKHMRINHSKEFADKQKSYKWHREFLEIKPNDICGNLMVFLSIILCYI